MSNKALLDSWLDDVIERKVQICLYVTSGVRLVGVVQAYDDEVIMLKSPHGEMPVNRYTFSSMKEA